MQEGGGMIIGECPYCDAIMMNSIGALPLPRFQKLTTECCQGTIWLRHSRIDPVAYTEDAFLQEYEVDEDAKTIKPLKRLGK